jgi:hypothetical protein
MGTAHATQEYNVRFLNVLRTRSWIRRVVVVKEPHPCPACIELAEAYDRRNLPELPVRRCSRPGRCTCWYAVSVAKTA